MYPSDIRFLLEKGRTKGERKEWAEKIGISETLMLGWVKMADLSRIEGVGEEYLDILEKAGADTVVELSKRVPGNLHAKLKEINEQKKLVNQLPTLDIVKKWIRQAKTLPRVVEY